MRKPRLARHNISCSFCKTEFFPSSHHWDRWRKGKPTYCSRACVAARFEADALARIPQQPCTTCGKLFTLSDSQRDKIKSRPGTGLYCSTECLHESRKHHSRAMWENGKIPPWGSERQKAAAKRLGEYSSANKKFGLDHPGYKTGEWTNEARAERRARWQRAQARREAAPKQYPCMLCGVGFEFSGKQRQRWYKKGSSVQYSCSSCKNKTSMAARPPYYYAPAECSGCGVVFNPEENQRMHRSRNPDAKIFCSAPCVTDYRENMLEEYRAEHGVPWGPSHPSWKTGWHSKQAQEARRLVHNLKKYIKEGASQ